MRSAEEANLKKDKAALEEHLKRVNARKNKLSCMTQHPENANLNITKVQERKVERMMKLGGLLQEQYDLTVTIHGMIAKLSESHPRILVELEELDTLLAAGRPPTKPDGLAMERPLAAPGQLSPHTQKFWDTIVECEDAIGKVGVMK